MRISDWSSDVCSSDLAVQRVAVPIGGEGVDPGDAELAKRGGSQFADRPRARESEPGVKLIDIVDADVAHRIGARAAPGDVRSRSEEHTSELQSLLRNSYAVFPLKKKIENHYSYTS